MFHISDNKMFTFMLNCVLAKDFVSGEMDLSFEDGNFLIEKERY